MKESSVEGGEQVNQRKQQQDLVDLPDEAPESPLKQLIFTPKILLLLATVIIFIGRNVYMQYTKEPKSAIQGQQESKIKQEEQISPQLFNRFFWYIVLTVVFFVFYIFLRRSNDTADEQKIRQQIRIQEEQQIKNKKIQEKAYKIAASIDQFGNVVDDQPLKRQQQSQQQSTQIKKDN